MTQEVIHMTNTLPEAQVAAWLKMAEKKNQLTKILQASELELQGLLINVKDADLVSVMASYKTKYTTMKDARLLFTNAIDSGIVQPLMTFEKRCAPDTYQPFIDAKSRELAVRTKAAAALQRDSLIAAETGQFKAHFINEYNRIVADLRMAYARVISEAYTMCLTAKTPADKVDSAIQIAISAMGEIKPGTVSKFNRIHLDAEQAAIVYQGIVTPNYDSIFSDAVENINEKFSMYANDLANAESAIAGESTHLQVTIIEAAQELAQETAATTLIAQAEAFVIAPEGFKGVTETTKITIEDNSQSWVVKIMTAFLANFGDTFNKIRVKKYSALTVAQMAAALDSAGIKVEGVQYETVCK